uniref:Uncharacterized protein n=1 Tax=Octopus bimaculoides TaxID=37653 RepID=A0A0L8FY57_OCTBM
MYTYVNILGRADSRENHHKIFCLKLEGLKGVLSKVTLVLESRKCSTVTGNWFSSR